MKSFRSKPVGWRGESYRHYLAAKGFKTRRYDAIQESKAETFLKSFGKGVAAVPQRIWTRQDMRLRKIEAEGAEPYRERLKVSRSVIATPLTREERAMQEALMRRKEDKVSLHGAAAARDAFNNRWTEASTLEAMGLLESIMESDEEGIKDAKENISSYKDELRGLDPVQDADRVAILNNAIIASQRNMASFALSYKNLQIDLNNAERALNNVRAGKISDEDKIILGNHQLNHELRETMGGSL